ncbi:MAG: hypothetical protein ACKVOQ_12700 [Cyclobacteriaceae bacterium]
MAQSDEIDLLDLAVKLNRIFVKNLKSLIIAFVIGTAAGLAFYQFVPKVYESKMILLSDILTSSYSERITESLDNLIKEQNSKVLSERIGLTFEQAKQIVKIEIESVKQKEAKDDKSESATFIVTIRTKNNSILPQLQDGIINYLRNNEYVKIRVRQRQDFYKAMIEKVGQEINSLDSLKRRLFSGQPIYSKSSEMMLVDPTNIYSKIIELSKERISYKNSLELVNSIQLVEGFTIFDKPTSPKLSISLASGASLGIFFVLALIGIKGFRKMVNLANEKQDK